MRCLLAILVTLAIAACASMPPSPTQVTPQELIARPDAYKDKTVSVRGQVDNCISLTCNLCPEDMTNKTYDHDKCLGLSFNGFSPCCSWEDVRTSEAMERAFRFATVTLSARFDPTCLTGRTKSSSGITETVVCTDRATVLYDAIVQEVHSRKTADTGIISWYDFGKLSAPAADDQRSMLALLKDLDPENKRQLQLFITPDSADKAQDIQFVGLACYCLENKCDGKWPTKWAGGFDNYGNDFYCYALRKKHGVWSVLPGEF